MILRHINYGGVDVQEDDVLLNITGDSVARCCVVPNGPYQRE